MPLSPSRTVKTARYAVYFDGVDDYASIANFDFRELSGGFTFELFLAPAARMMDWVRHISAPIGYLRIMYELDYNRMFFAARDTIANEYFSATSLTDSVRPFTSTHAVFTWNVSRGCWHINGSLNVCKDDTRTNKGMGYTGLYIGRRIYAEWAQGYLPFIRVYTRPLTSEEIAWNYKYPWNPVRRDLIMWLHAHPDYVKDIDNDGILEWIDLSGNNNHAKLYGASLVSLIRSPSR